MVDIAVLTENIGPDSTQQGIVKPSDITEVGCTLDLALFAAAGQIVNGVIPALTPLGKVTATNLYGPYGGGDVTTDEVVTITVGGSGLTSFTLTFGGQTTASIDDQATGADVQTALRALSTIDLDDPDDDVTVTGPAGGPWVVTFTSALANTNVGAITSTPTGGSGTVTPVVTVAGGAEGAADGRQVGAGLLFDSIPTRGKVTGNVGASRIVLGAIYEGKLPFPVDAGFKTDVPTIAFVN